MKYRLAPDYECFPVWRGDGTDFRNVDPASLLLPRSLIAAIATWAGRYEATYNRSDPVTSGFRSAEEEAAFDQEGRRLWAALEEALGPDNAVEYFSIATGWERRP